MLELQGENACSEENVRVEEKVCSCRDQVRVEEKVRVVEKVTKRRLKLRRSLGLKRR